MKSILRNPTQQKPTNVFEMLDLIQAQPDHASRVMAIRSLQPCPELNAFLQLNYALPGTRQLDLPEGAPRFEADDGDPDMSLTRTRNVIPDLVQLSASNQRLTPAQKLKRFVGILESINVREAEALILAKDRRLETKWTNLNARAVREAVPGLI